MQQDVLAAIPHRPPFLFIDKIIETRPDGILCQRTLRTDETFYAGHYPGNPITPGVLLCEAVFQAGAIFLTRKIVADGGDPSGRTPVVCRIEKARFKNMVFPGDTVSIEVTFNEKMQEFYFLSGRVLSDGKTVLTLNFALSLIQQQHGVTAATV